MMNASQGIDTMIETAVFTAEPRQKEARLREIRELALGRGIRPASIQGLYEASGRGAYRGITVPAINIRGITYDVAGAVFRAAMKENVGAYIFELARSEMGYTVQSPAEYTAAVLAAAVKEKFEGPVFIQADHTQVSRSKYKQDAAAEVNAIKELVGQAVAAGFYNIDIDASTVVELDRKTLEEQQEDNSRITVELTEFIRGIEPPGVTVSVGGEIGEIGKGNSTVADLRAFMGVYRRRLRQGVKGISKISVQTGTTHGGVVLADGSIARVDIDFNTLKELSDLARREYGLGGAVQHGASTLPDEAFDTFPKCDTLEVHLATGFQNIIYDSAYFPGDLRASINRFCDEHYQNERKAGETEEQFIYKTRKRAFGDFKKELWHLPPKVNRKIMAELEERFSLMFHKLNVVNTTGLIKKHVTY
jgi:fructose/tagatose bisphosphate aldolase